VYSERIREELAAAIDTRKLAETWRALHPGTVKAAGPALAAFLKRALDALVAALERILPQAWTEGWVLGQQAAQAVLADGTADWGGWTPGDYAAAELIAGPGLRQLLDAEGIVIRSIAGTRIEEIAELLEATLASDITGQPPREPGEEFRPVLSVAGLAARLEEILDNPERAELVAQAEIGRAQAEAARTAYAAEGVTEVEISTAHDDRVCEICRAAAAAGPHPVGTAPMALLHPRCRCAELPVLASVAA
jgi:hypothetical protein